MVYARIIIPIWAIYVLYAHSAAISPPEKKMKKNQNPPLRIRTAYGRLCGVDTTKGATLDH